MKFLKNFFNSLAKIHIDEIFLEELETVFIEADFGTKTTGLLLEYVKDLSHRIKVTDPEEVKKNLKEYIKGLILNGELISSEGLKIILFTGINGAGKTTSLVKLANLLIQKKYKIKIVAGDTFRDAAIEQLDIWAIKLKVPIIKTIQGSDPGAIIYDGIKSALNDGTEYLIIDTAGRMYTNENLMRELQKIRALCLKYVKDSHIENILVVDSITGQNGFIQAESFNKIIPVTGIFLSKYDSIFKSGIIIRISSELKIPIKFIGTGESLTDLNLFDKNDFIEALGF